MITNGNGVVVFIVIGFACVILGLGCTASAITNRSAGQFWFGVTLAGVGVASVCLALLSPHGGA